MEKDLIFFGSEGLTSTSANHIANLAKECVKFTNDSLANVKLGNKFLTIAGCNDSSSTQIQVGWKLEKLNGITEKLNTVAQANALIAWLREAIKARESLLQEVKDMDLLFYCKKFNLEFPEAPNEEAPISREDYIATLSIKERNEILSLGAKASVYGKYIHENGKFAIARDEYLQKMGSNMEVREQFDKIIVTRYEGTVTPEELDEVFFNLQAEYRSTQAQLNAYNHKIDEAVRADSTKKSGEYLKANAEYNAKVAEITKQFEEYKDSESKRIADLKIIIPNSLREIYEKVNKLGK